MKDIPPYMNWFPRDSQSDAKYRCLDDRAKLLYRHLIDLQWTCGGALPADAGLIRRMADVDDVTWERHSALILSPPYFHLTDAGFCNNRCSKEFERTTGARTQAQMANAARKVRSGGRNGGRPRKSNGESNGNPTEIQRKIQRLSSQLSALSSHGSSPSSQLSEKDSGEVSPDPSCSTGGSNGAVKRSRKRKPYPPEFEDFWEHYPRRSGKEDAAKAFLEAAGRPGVTAAGLAERSTAFGEALGPGLAMGAPLAGTWLRAGRYDDDPDEWIRMACRTLKLPDPTRPVIGEREARSALAIHQWQTQEIGR